MVRGLFVFCFSHVLHVGVMCNRGERVVFVFTRTRLMWLCGIEGREQYLFSHVLHVGVMWNRGERVVFVFTRTRLVWLCGIEGRE